MKYSKELISLGIGLFVLSIIFILSHIAEKESLQDKAKRNAEIQTMFSLREESSGDEGDDNSQTTTTITTITTTSEVLNQEDSQIDLTSETNENNLEATEEVVEEVVEEAAEEVVEEVSVPVPGTFSSYVVSVRIELQEDTEAEKAICDVKKACTIIRSSPTIRGTEVVGVKGRVIDESGEEKLFDLRMDD